MKVFLDTVGCRLNQAEIEIMASQFRAAGHEIVPAAEVADLAVVNTCAVTGHAVADSRAAIRRISRAGAAKVVATGCWATLQPDAAAALCGVQSVVNNAAKERLVASVLGTRAFSVGFEPPVRHPLPGLHRRTRAFIKVQDGCDSHCTFCITTIARGRGRSREIQAVLDDIRMALAGGAQEIVLTGVHLGSWGKDLGTHLRALLVAILQDTDVRRLRLSSLEPWDLDEMFFRLWDSPRLCRHLHLPLQSGCAATLKRMARRITPGSFRRLVSAARSCIPGVAITTDVISGFPGETEAEFSQSIEFAREIDFAGGHGFSYSPRPGTAAVRLPDPVAPHLARARTAIFRSLFEEQSRAYRRGFVGQTAGVLWESTTSAGDNGWRLEGLTDNYIRVRAISQDARWNVLDTVGLTDLTETGLSGVIHKRG